MKTNLADAERVLSDQLFACKISCRTAVSLALYTTFRIGGKADLFAEPRTERELILTLREAEHTGCPVFLLGRGSNVLFSDEGYRGIVIFTGGICDRQIQGTQLLAACGESLSGLAVFSAKNCLSGMEFCYGIPGSLGGAICMNAGAYDGEMKDIVSFVDAYDRVSDRVCRFAGEELEFSYRRSLFLQNPRYAVLRAGLKLTQADEASIAARMQENLQKRKQKQPLNLPSAGSIFKRPQGAFAGALIEQCGLKGLRVGDAQVSEKHAGFIVNLGNATASDVVRLIEKIEYEVEKQCHVRLEPEVQLIKSNNS